MGFKLKVDLPWKRLRLGNHIF